MGRLILDGQTILVTRATGAIGRAMCKALSADGAKVLIHYGRNCMAAEGLLADNGGKGALLPADLSDPKAPEALWGAAEAHGPVTGLVNNAGIRSEVDVETLMAEWQTVWEKEFRVNFMSAVDLTKSAITHFRQHGGGRIVNMASRAGQRGYV